jgi:hypothetical protein
VTISYEIDDAIEKRGQVMVKQLPETPDAEMVNEWLESVGGQIRTGAAKLRSVKLSKDGDKMTLVIKRKSRKEENPEKQSP